MRALSHAECLALWEAGRGLHPLDRGLLAIQVASTTFGPDGDASAADWPLGRRNHALAELRRASFGPSLEGWTACRACGEKLEFKVDANALLASVAPAQDARVRGPGGTFRLPTSRDLAHVAGERDSAVAALRLVQRCAVANDVDAASGWTEEDVDAIGEQMALADPLAEILLHFDCPTCQASFDQSLDLSAFLWSEIEGRAKRLLRDVHALASAYGWSEVDILGLTPARRDFYLEMVRA
ncbi:MAG TPA: hypothetical protein VGI39_33395 [Polyangiaceae bacterium]|jgi:hypothetical protein